MEVRNFWIEANIDGRESLLRGGPRAKDGGMRVIIKQRKNGGITTALTISSREVDGKLLTEVYDANHNILHTSVTER